jgi:hypothetical protein
LSSLLDVPFRSGVLLGWRAWRVVKGDLVSVSAQERWPHYARLEARHGLDTSGAGEHAGAEAPCFGNLHCGIYAYSSPSALNGFGPSSDAWGEVKLWGRVIRHQYAYRAQYAYPSLVIVRDEFSAQLLRRNYGCEVLVDAAPSTPGAGDPIVANLVAQGQVLMVDMSINWNGQYYVFKGIADPDAIGRWFGGIVSTMGRNPGPGSQSYVQLQSSFYLL